MANLPVQVWAKGEGWLSTTPMQFSGGPIRTAADGSFQTPAALLEGAEYRVVLNFPGAEPAFSRWVKIDKKTRGILPLVLRPLRTIKGRIVDRQGKPVAGVRVFQSGDGPEPTTAIDRCSGAFCSALVFARDLFSCLPGRKDFDSMGR